MKRVGRTITFAPQILSITCDNASPNDVMTNALADLVEEFPGATNRTRCFAHILNLVVKVVIHQFNVPEAKSNKVFDVATQTLVDLAGDIDIEGEIMDRKDDEEGDDDKEEGAWVNPWD